MVEQLRDDDFLYYLWNKREAWNPAKSSQIIPAKFKKKLIVFFGGILQ